MATDPAVERLVGAEQAAELLLALGADRVEHPGGTLSDLRPHLAERTVLAGLGGRADGPGHRAGGDRAGNILGDDGSHGEKG